MKKLEEKKIKEERIFQGRLLGLRVDTVKLPNGVKSTREVVEHPGAVAVIALTKDKKIVLIRQYRCPTGRVILEVPAGVPLKNEKGATAAKRELEEETGYRAKKVRKVWEGYASPGYSDEVIKFYLAEGLTFVGTNMDEDEMVEVEIIGINQGYELLKKGKIKDNKTIIGLMIAKLKINGEL